LCSDNLGHSPPGSNLREGQCCKQRQNCRCKNLNVRNSSRAKNGNRERDGGQQIKINVVIEDDSGGESPEVLTRWHKTIFVYQVILRN